jgi:fluoroacetyl-CoA thioesterase
MRNIFSPGDQKIFKKKVAEVDTAAFFHNMVHPVYATFSIARDAEWSGRLFVLELREEDEEGIGTSISVNHHAPAFPGEEVTFIATLKEIRNHEIITTFEAMAGNRLIATGEQGQKIFKKARLEKLFSSAKKQLRSDE